MRDIKNLRKIGCENCIWFDYCADKYMDGCIDYSPYDDMDDEYVDRIIEDRRIEFRREWFEYIDEMQ